MQLDATENSRAKDTAAADPLPTSLRGGFLTYVILTLLPHLRLASEFLQEQGKIVPAGTQPNVVCPVPRFS